MVLAPPIAGLFSKPSSVSLADAVVLFPNPFRNFLVSYASDSAFSNPSGSVDLDGVFEVIYAPIKNKRKTNTGNATRLNSCIL